MLLKTTKQERFILSIVAILIVLGIVGSIVL